ncbi:MAG: acetyl-CoA hydrolase/transferase family protein, partial [Robiginitalea sp.]
MNIVSLETAAGYVKSGDRVFVQGAAMTPNALVNAICDRYRELKQVEIISIHTDGTVNYAHPPYNESFKINSCFVGANVRKAVNTNKGDYIPIFLSEIHLLFRRNLLPLDVAVVQVSPPDKHGFCSLGVSVDVTLPAVQTAKKVIAQLNPQVPRTHGDGIIHISQIDALVEISEPIHTFPISEISETEERIGKHVASLVEDGATLQMGIGNIPDAVLKNLDGHKRLGVHTEMFSDGLLPLIEKGVITGEEKEIKTNKIVTCFAAGSKKLYEFLDDNPTVHFKEAAYTNDTTLIRRNPKVTAINSAIEIDITTCVYSVSSG